MKALLKGDFTLNDITNDIQLRNKGALNSWYRCSFHHKIIQNFYNCIEVLYLQYSCYK